MGNITVTSDQTTASYIIFSELCGESTVGPGGKYHRSPQPPPPGLPADCRTALGARPQKLQSGPPWAAAASPPSVRSLPWSLSSPRVAAPWSCCRSPGSALSCQAATGQPGASEKAGCLLFDWPYCCINPTFASEDKIELFITLTYMKRSFTERTESVFKKRRGTAETGCFDVFLAVCFHSRRCMNGA